MHLLKCKAKKKGGGMLKNNFIVLGILLVFLCAAPARAENYRIMVSEDAWVNQANPSTNYGNSTYLSVKDTSKFAEIYLKFDSQDLRSINLKNQKIISASLNLYQYQGNYPAGDNVNIHVVDENWNEASITWQNKPNYKTEILNSIFLNEGTELWRKWSNLESIFDLWQKGNNYGLVLENNKDLKAEELFARFYSSEYSDLQKRPFLEVVTRTVPDPISWSLFLLGAASLGLCKLRKL